MHNKPSRNQILLYAAELLVILLLLPGCFRKPVQTAVFDGTEFVRQTGKANPSDAERYVSGGMELRPGVYQVMIDSELQDGQLCRAALVCEDKPFRSLRGNGIQLWAGREHTVSDYYACDYYVCAHLKDVFVRLSFEDGDVSGGIREVRIYRTGAGNRILLTLFLICGGVLNGLLAFRRRIREGRVTKQRQIVFFSLVGVTLLAFFPYLTDYMILGTDSAGYLLRMETLASESVSLRQSLREGLLPLYLPAALRRIGFSTMASYKPAVLLSVCLALWGAYHALRRCIQTDETTREYAALLGAMTYALCPWSLRLLYREGAWGRYLIFAALPLLCISLWELLQRRYAPAQRLYSLILSLLWAALIFQGFLLDRSLSGGTGENRLVRWAPLLLTLLLAAAVSTLYIRTQKHKQIFLFAALLLLLIPAVYYVNEIAFHSDVYYLYSAEPLFSGI